MRLNFHYRCRGYPFQSFWAKKPKKDFHRHPSREKKKGNKIKIFLEDYTK
jgi:hypothetical protein